MKHFILHILLLVSLALPAAAQFNLGWAKKMTSTNGNVWLDELATDAFGNIYQSGRFSGIADLDPGLGTHLFTADPNFYSRGFIQKLSPEGQLLWLKVFDNIDQAWVTQIKPDQDGNLYFTGRLGGGTITFPQYNIGIAIGKISPQGNLIWMQKITCLTGSGTAATGFDIDSDGNIYAVGSYYGTVDFNPSPTITYNLSASSQHAYLLKLDVNGNFVWVKTLMASVLSEAHGIQIANNNLNIAGWCWGTVDFDPNAGEHIVNIPQQSGFWWCVGLNGIFQWERHFGSDDDQTWITAMDIDRDGNLVATGKFSGTVDLDPSTGVNNHSTGSPDIPYMFVQKLGPSGNFLWAKSFPSSGPLSYSTQPQALAIDQNNQILLLGEFAGTLDVNPGPATQNLNSGFNDFDVFLISLNPDGSLADAAVVAGTALQQSGDVMVDIDNSIILNGNFEATIDVNPGPASANLTTNSFYKEGFLLKWTKGWDYHGSVFLDLNNNQVQDSPLELGIANQLVGAPQINISNATDSSGVFHINYPLAGKVLSVILPAPYWHAEPPGILLDTMPQGPFQFAVTIDTVKDVRITMIALDVVRPGFPTRLLLRVENIGTLPAEAVDVNLKLVSEGLIFVSSIPEEVAQNGNVVYWNTPPLLPGETYDISATVQATFPLNFGNAVVLSASALLEDDAYLINNGTRVVTEVVGSFDPNDKAVSPFKTLPDELDTTLFQYLIRFQNTGNYPADFVVIRDTLSEALDLTSLHVIGASHAYTWRLVGERALEFKFDQIYLPDSTSNEPESHGFVVFNIKAKSGLMIGDSIRNRAGIYFDYNEPVITNYATMKMVQTIGATEPGNSPALDFQISPNPATARAVLTIDFPGLLDSAADIQLFDAQGKTVQSLQLNNGEKQLTLPGLSPGSYFVQVRAGGRVGGQVLLITR